jgi:hypothetical protein
LPLPRLADQGFEFRSIDFRALTRSLTLPRTPAKICTTVQSPFRISKALPILE